MEQIGREWSDGNLNPAQEHLASNGVRYTLQTMYRLIEPKQPVGTMILACVDEELHDLPLFGLAVEMATLGWKCMMLGARVPAYAVSDALVTREMSLGLALQCPLVSRGPILLLASLRACDRRQTVGRRRKQCGLIPRRDRTVWRARCS